MSTDYRGELEENARAAARKAGEDKMFAIWENARGKDPSWSGPCPQCGEPVEVAHGTLAHYMPLCKCARAVRDQTYQEYRRTHWQEAVAGQWRQANIPRRFFSARFSTFSRLPGTQQAIKACCSYAHEYQLHETTSGLFLAGPYGCGKTHLAVATAWDLVERQLCKVHFAQVSTLLNELKASDFDWTPVEQATRSELLILDDLAQDALTAFDRRILFDLVNARYEQMRPTIFTTNASERVLTELLGGALVSRLYEMAELVEIQATDYRRGGMHS